MTDRWIVGSSFGWRPGRRTSLLPGPVFEHLAALAGATGRVRLTVLGTAGGDSESWSFRVHEAFYGTRFDVTVLRLLPYGCGVHYDSEEQRRPLLHQLVADDTLPLSYATDDGCGIVYRGTEVHEVVADREGAQAYRVELVDGVVRETALPARLLA